MEQVVKMEQYVSFYTLFSNFTNFINVTTEMYDYFLPPTT